MSREDALNLLREEAASSKMDAKVIRVLIELVSS